MSEQEPLPRFKKPPVSEVVVGVQFQTPELTPIHLGLYYQKIKDRFPVVNTHPPLPPVFETFGLAQPAQFGFPFPFFPMEAGVSPIQPRMWFITNDGDSLIQLQSGRLIVNWRAVPNKEEYPHFDAVYEQFTWALDQLEELVQSERLGELSVNQCEVLYVNPISASVTGVGLDAPEKIFRTWCNNNRGEEWPKPLEDLAFNARFLLTDEEGNPNGRLTVAVTSGWLNFGTPDASPSFKMELTARGFPQGAGRDGVSTFHHQAHKAIVQCFAALTTNEMHALWGRYQ